jgi:hypothetical protein
MTEAQLKDAKQNLADLKTDETQFLELLEQSQNEFETAKTNGTPASELATLRGKIVAAEALLEDQRDSILAQEMQIATLEREFNVTAKRAYILEQNQAHATAMRNQTAILAEVEAFHVQKREALSIENQAMQSANREAITTARALGAENENAVSKVIAEICAEAGSERSVDAWGANSRRWPWIKDN